MQSKSRVLALPLAAILASGAFFHSAPAQAAPKSKTYKAGAVALGALGVYMLSKGKTVEGAAILGGGYLAYKQGQKQAKKEQYASNYGYGNTGNGYYNNGSTDNGYYNNGSYNNGNYNNGSYNNGNASNGRDRNWNTGWNNGNSGSGYNNGGSYYNGNASYNNGDSDEQDDRQCQDEGLRSNGRGNGKGKGHAYGRNRNR